MPMFLFWSQVSNCWWLCELSSHLFRLPRVGHIPSQKLVLPRQDQSPPSIGPLSPVLLSHWRMEAQPVWPAPLALFFNCAMVYKFLSNSFPSCNSREISRSWSENIPYQVSKSGPAGKASQPELLSEDAGISSPCGPLRLIERVRQSRDSGGESCDGFQIILSTSSDDYRLEICVLWK